MIYLCECLGLPFVILEGICIRTLMDPRSLWKTQIPQTHRLIILILLHLNKLRPLSTWPPRVTVRLKNPTGGRQMSRLNLFTSVAEELIDSLIFGLRCLHTSNNTSPFAVKKGPSGRLVGAPLSSVSVTFRAKRKLVEIIIEICN